MPPQQATATRMIDSPTDSFIGPEAPGRRPIPNPGGAGYKDALGRIKRQVTRFRLYGLDESCMAAYEEDGMPVNHGPCVPSVLSSAPSTGIMIVDSRRRQHDRGREWPQRHQPVDQRLQVGDG